MNAFYSIFSRKSFQTLSSGSNTKKNITVSVRKKALYTLSQGQIKLDVSVLGRDNGYTVSVLGQEEGYTIKYTPLLEGVSEGKARGNSRRRRGIFESSPNTDSISF